jgi:hypothetical protein
MTLLALEGGMQGQSHRHLTLVVNCTHGGHSLVQCTVLGFRQDFGILSPTLDFCRSLDRFYGYARV